MENEILFEFDACVRCGSLLQPNGNYFITEIGTDSLWACPNCGLKYDVEHECHPDFCMEALTVAK